MVTLDDVAARAGVSRMTASNALRGKTVVRPETARKVIAAAEELGYHPNLAARQLSSGRTHVIGLTVADFDLIFPAALAAAISDRAQTLGYQVIVQQTRFSHDFERRMLSSATSQICDGTIICWPSSASAEEARNAFSTSSAERTRRMPRPPPPALAFTSSGNPIFSASRLAVSTSGTRSQPGTTGTPASRMVRLA